MYTFEILSSNSILSLYQGNHVGVKFYLIKIFTNEEYYINVNLCLGAGEEFHLIVPIPLGRRRRRGAGWFTRSVSSHRRRAASPGSPLSVTTWFVSALWLTPSDIRRRMFYGCEYGKEKLPFNSCWNIVHSIFIDFSLEMLIIVLELYNMNRLNRSINPKAVFDEVDLKIITNQVGVFFLWSIGF